MGRTIVRFDATKPAAEPPAKDKSSNETVEQNNEYVVDDSLLERYFTELIGEELTTQMRPLWRVSRPNGEPIVPNYTEWLLVYFAMSHQVRYRSNERRIVAIIGDEDTVTGFLLAGVGDNRATGADSSATRTTSAANANAGTARSGPPPNYFVVTSETPLAEIETAFTSMCERKDIGIIIICQHIANDIRHLIQDHKQVIPSVLEIPSRGQKYDAARDPVLERISLALGIR